jgi:hypothetical protein
MRRTRTWNGVQKTRQCVPEVWTRTRSRALELPSSSTMGSSCGGSWAGSGSAMVPGDGRAMSSSWVSEKRRTPRLLRREEALRAVGCRENLRWSRATREKLRLSDSLGALQEHCLPLSVLVQPAHWRCAMRDTSTRETEATRVSFLTDSGVFRLAFFSFFSGCSFFSR